MFWALFLHCFVCMWSIEGSPDDYLCSLDNPLNSLSLCLCDASIPDRDASGEVALHLSSVGLCEWVATQHSLPEQPDEVQPLLSLFQQRIGVCSPAQVRWHLEAEELVGVLSLIFSPFDDEWLQ